MLSDTIQRIAELQKSWSSANTPEMEERGILIRQTMVEELEAYRDEFSRSLSSHGTDYSPSNAIWTGQGSDTMSLINCCNLIINMIYAWANYYVRLKISTPCCCNHQGRSIKTQFSASLFPSRR